MTKEEKLKKIQQLRPIDDIFFQVLAEKKEVCQEIIQTILNDDSIIVEEVTVQKSEKNIYGRSVILDALCVLNDGSRCNIEIQRADNDDHLRRIRFNAASITVKDSDVGEHFKDVKDVCVIYISEHDFLGKERTMYHIDNVVRETGEVVDDGFTRILVNTEVDDKTDVAELMSCFKQTSVNNSKFPKLSDEVNRIKNHEGGRIHMCKIMEDMINEAVNDAVNETAIKTVIKTAIEYSDSKNNIIQKLQKDFSLSEAEALEKYESVVAKVGVSE